MRMTCVRAWMRGCVRRRVARGAWCVARGAVVRGAWRVPSLEAARALSAHLEVVEGAVGVVVAQHPRVLRAYPERGVARVEAHEEVHHRDRPLHRVARGRRAGHGSARAGVCSGAWCGSARGGALRRRVRAAARRRLQHRPLLCTHLGGQQRGAWHHGRRARRAGALGAVGVSAAEGVAEARVGDDGDARAHRDAPRHHAHRAPALDDDLGDGRSHEAAAAAARDRGHEGLG